MWDLPGPGIEPMSPALAGGFLTTEAPGKSPATLKNGEEGNDGGDDVVMMVEVMVEMMR